MGRLRLMTKDRIENLKILIEKSRSRLMSKAPTFALLLMYVEFVAVPGMDRISTNGKSIFFEPSFLIKLYPEEIDFLLCHQIMHILSEDVWRREILAYSNFHYSCDLRINSILLDVGLSQKYFSHLGEIQYKIPGANKSLTEMTQSEMLSQMLFDLDKFDVKLKHKFIVDSDVCWLGGQKFLGGTVILKPKIENEYLDIFGEVGKNFDGNSNEGVSEEIFSWKRRAALAYNATEKSENDECGELAQFMCRLIEGMTDASIDWRKIINDFISEEVCDYSFSPPDRRFSDCAFFLPDFNENDFVSKEILFMVDTSASVNDRNLAAVYSEIKGALEQYDGKLHGELGFFDCEVTEPVPISSVDDLLTIKPIGGGGTNFFSVFSYIKNRSCRVRPAYIIIFTDGESDFPDESAALNIPVLWVIDNNDVTPPWGKVVRIKSRLRNRKN